MKSVFSFIVKPLGERYENSITVDNKELLLNTKIESFKSVNNVAVVIATPLAFKTEIKEGDLVVIHHNVFRRFYDMKGKSKNSASYFKDDQYFCNIDQIYLYKNDNKWIAFLSFPNTVSAIDHPFYKRVMLRLMPVSGGAPKAIDYLYGGQGTINTPSWSPDSKFISFVSNSGPIQ